MELKGTKTEKNLMEAFAGESQARNKYTFFASMAKKEGYEQLAAIFEETAGNEKEHAKIWFKLLCGGAIPDTLTCLDMAAGGEHDEWTEMYPRMAREAKEEGFPQIPRRAKHGQVFGPFCRAAGPHFVGSAKIRFSILYKTPPYPGPDTAASACFYQ